jgi:hypothetical protein
VHNHNATMVCVPACLVQLVSSVQSFETRRSCFARAYSYLSYILLIERYTRVIMKMDQLLEGQACSGLSSKSRRNNPLLEPIKDIYRYASLHGIRALYGGAVPLLLRELCYISAITVANPLVTAAIEERTPAAQRGWSVWGLMGAFSVGFTAGLTTAPFQVRGALLPQSRRRRAPLSSRGLP